MKLTLVIIILASVALSAVAQILLKTGMIAKPVQIALQSGDLATLSYSVFTSPYVLSGLICFGLSVIAWLFVLSSVPLSSAYPFVALGIFVTSMAGLFLFDEGISLTKAFGILTIILGIVLVALGS